MQLQTEITEADRWRFAEQHQGCSFQNEQNVLFWCIAAAIIFVMVCDFPFQGALDNQILPLPDF